MHKKLLLTSLLFLLLLAPAMANIPTDQLRAYFPLNETSGLTFADDGTGTYTADFTANSGSVYFLNGSICPDGGTCLNVTAGAESNGGSSSGALISSSATNLSMIVWIKATPSGTSWRQITGQHTNFRLLYDGSGNVACQVEKNNGGAGGSWTDKDIATASALSGEFHLVGCFWDSTNQVIGTSLDGSAIEWGSSIGDSMRPTNFQYAGLGGRAKNSDFRETAVAHYAVYDKLLSDSDVVSYMDATNGTEPEPPASPTVNVLLNLTFDTDLTDSSPNNHTFTSNGGASITTVDISNRIGVLNLTATSGDYINSTWKSNLTNVAISRWIYYQNQPGGSNEQADFEFSSGTELMRTMYSVYAYNPDWQTSVTDVTTNTAGSGTVSNGAWYHIFEQYNGSNYTIWINGNDYSKSASASGDLLVDAGDTLIIGQWSSRNLEGYLDEFVVYDNGEFTEEQVEAIYQAGVKGSARDLDLVITNVSINSDLSYKYNFSAVGNPYNLSGTIPYAFEISNVGVTNNSGNFNVTTYIDGVLLCDTRLNLTTISSYTIYCNVSKDLGYRVLSVVVDSYGEVNEDLESNNDAKSGIDFSDFFPSLADMQGAFGSYISNSSNSLSYDAYIAIKNFNAEDFNPSWGVSDVDPRGKKGYVNALSCFINEYDQGANFFCDRAYNHLDGWLALSGWDGGNTQAVHGFNFVVKTYRLMLANMTKEQATNYSREITRVHNELFSHPDYRPDLDPNESSVGNGYGFGSGTGAGAFFMQGEDVNNPSLFWFNPAEYQPVSTLDAWNGRVIKHISNDGCPEGYLYCSYSNQYIGEYLAYYDNAGDPYNIVNTYNNEICSVAQEFINGVLEFDNFAIGKSGAQARWSTYGDSYYDVGIGSTDVIGSSMLDFFAQACNNETIKRGVVTLRTDLNLYETFNQNKRPEQSIYSFYNLSNLQGYNRTELQSNFAGYINPVWDDLTVNRFNYNITKELQVKFSGGDTADYGHPFAHFDIYGFYNGIEFLGFPQVAFNDDVRTETHTNTLSFSNDTTTAGYVSTCTAVLNQYYGGATDLDMSLYPFTDDNFNTGNCIGSQYGQFYTNDGRFATNVMTQPYDVSTEQQKRINVLIDDLLLDVWLVNASGLNTYSNYNSISDEVTGVASGNTVSLSNGSTYWNITSVYNTTAVSVAGGVTDITPSGEKTSLDPMAGNYSRFYHTWNTTDQEVIILAHKFYTNSYGNSLSSTTSNGDAGVIVNNGSSNYYVYFDTDKSGLITARNFTTDAEVLAIDLNGSGTFMVSGASYVTEEGESLFNGSQSSFMSTYNTSVYNDTTPPVISSVTASSITSSGATISWSTDENATSIVYYGTTTSYGSTSQELTPKTSHSIGLTSLSASTRYYYKVSSCDSNNNCANSTGSYFDTLSSGGGGGGPVSGDGVSTITFKAYEYITNDLLTDYTLYTGYGLLGTESSSGFTTTSNGYDFNWSTTSVKSVSEGSGGNDDSVYQFLFDSQYVGIIYYKGKITTSAVSTQTNNIQVEYYDGTSWNTIESNSCSNSCTANLENNYTLNLNISGLRFSFHSGDIGSGWDATYTVYELGFHGINNTEGDVLNYTGASEEIIVLAVNGYYSQEVSFSVSNDTDSTVNVMDFYNTLLSIDLRDAISGSLVTAGDQYVTVTDFNGWEETYNTSDGELDLNLTSSITTYGFTGWADNYAFNYVNTSVSAMTDGLNISLYANNSIYINVYDSTNGTSLDNYTATLTRGSNVYTESVGVGTYPLNFTEITSGIYRLIIERNGYLDSEYIVTMTEGSFQFLNAYLYTGSETVIFSLADNGNANPVENASVSMFKILNGSRILVNNKLSDVTGRVQLGYNTGDYYEFIVVAEGYENKEFILNPILFSSYNILLTPTASTAEDTDYSSVLITFSTEDYYINQSNSLVISIYSPDGSLQDYQFNITTELGTQAYSGTNAAGETFTYNFTLPTSPENQTVRISYCYDLTLSEQRCFVKKYTVIGAYDEQSLKALQDNTFGLGLLERLIIATIFSIFVGGLVAAVSGVIGGAAIGMLLFGFFTFTGFIPLWAILPSVLVLAVLIFGRSE